MRQRGFVPLTLILTIILILTSILSLKYFFPETIKPISLKQLVYGPTVTPTPFKSPPPKAWILRKGNEVINKTSQYSSPQLARYQDLLFYGVEISPEHEYAQIFSYNLKTGQRDEVFSDSKNQNTRRPIGLGDLKILNNVLYFSTGGYLQIGALYYINLPSGKTTQIIEGQNPSITKFKDIYLIEGGEGDACWGMSYFKLFNPQTKQVSPIASYDYSCGKGDSYLGIDSDYNLISAHSENIAENSSEFSSGTYTRIDSINAQTKKKVALIPESKMPQAVGVVKYSSENHQLILINQAVYLFSQDSDNLEKIIDIPNDFQGAYISSWKNQTLCLEKGTRNDSIVLNLETKNIQQSSTRCSPSATDNSYDKTVNFVKDLNLPSEYTFTLE